MGTKLYVGNLSYQTTDQELETLFAQAGNVADAVVIMDRDSGRSKGFGFVEMADEASAEAAIQRFNGTELGGRTLKVAEAKPRAPRSNDGGGGFNRSRW